MTGGNWDNAIAILNRNRALGGNRVGPLVSRDRTVGNSCIGSLVSRNRSIGHGNRSAGDRLVGSVMCGDVVAGSTDVVTPVGWNRAIWTGCVNRSWALGVGRIVVALGGDWAGRVIVGGNAVGDRRISGTNVPLGGDRDGGDRRIGTRL